MKKTPSDSEFRPSPPGERQGAVSDSQAQRRIVLQEAVKAASHPVRSSILRTLKECPASTIELEATTKRSRYDLYHHLGVLEKMGLVGHRFRDGKTKEFFMAEPARPEAVVFVLEREEFARYPEAVRMILDALETLEGELPLGEEDIEAVQVIFSLKSRARPEE